MIDPVSSTLSPYAALRGPAGAGETPIGRALAPGRMGEAGAVGPQSSEGGGFPNLIGGLVRAVDDKSKVSESEVRRLMLGESDSIHRSMIAMQEAGLAFNLLVEVRNKLVESYQELMRMPV